MTPDDREQVRRLFLAEGFVRVGFTTADAVRDDLSAWIAEGRQASMEWLAREPIARTSPERLLPGARTVICVAAAYPETDARGPIAGYARGEDYHRTMHDALQRATDALVGLHPGAKTRLCVDAMPLLERAFAARAGLGWIGKNTMLLDETHGPWLLLGEVLTDLEFPPDDVAVDRCGTCTACVEACPTEALGPGRTLDARRCISYWNIEHRGALPQAWADALGHRVFGCDDCLTACPFPARPVALAEPGGPFEPRPDLVDPQLDDLEARAGESFKRHFGSTPLERARKGGFLRNLAHCRQSDEAATPPEALQ